MAFIGVRELCRNSTQVFEQLEATGEPVVVARHGKPIAALVRVDEAQLQSLVLAAAPEFVESRREADEAVATGDIEPLSEVLSELNASEDESAGMLGELVDVTVGAIYETLIGQVSEGITQHAPIELEADDAASVRALNEDLMRTVLTTELQTSLRNTFDRVWAVNSNAISEASEELSADQYKSVLANASAVGRLSSVGGTSDALETVLGPSLRAAISGFDSVGARQSYAQHLVPSGYHIGVVSGGTDSDLLSVAEAKVAGTPARAKPAKRVLKRASVSRSKASRKSSAVGPAQGKAQSKPTSGTRSQKAPGRSRTQT